DAVRLYRKAIAAKPELVKDRAQQVRLSAACAAVRATSEVSEHAVDDEERAKLIGDALAWLDAELAVLSAIPLEKNESGRTALMQELNRWKNRTDLAPMRDSDPLRELSAEQQAKCRVFWRKVDRLLHEAIDAGR